MAEVGFKQLCNSFRSFMKMHPDDAITLRDAKEAIQRLESRGCKITLTKHHVILVDNEVVIDTNSYQKLKEAYITIVGLYYRNVISNRI